MHITKVVINNIRCFDDYSLQFPRGDISAVITGDNGVGKTTLLRCIAMCLCDESSAAALFRELRGRFVRNKSGKSGKLEGHIDLYLRSRTSQDFIIETKIQSLPSFEKVKQILYVGRQKTNKNKIESDKFPWSQIFVAGYGAGMRTLGTSSIDYYAPVDAVYTLFRYDEPLLSPELVLRRIKDENKKTGRSSQNVSLDELRKLLSSVLNLGSRGGVYLTRSGLEVSGPWGRTPIASVGDGYQSTITWVLDLVARKMLHGRRLNPRTLRGIVMVDEIEQHLHPIWQMGVLDLLQAAFPKVQFIVTTHSPLVITGSKSMPVYALDQSGYDGENIYGWRVEDVYREILGLESTRPKELAEDIRRWMELHFMTLEGGMRKTERNEYNRLQNMLTKTLHGSDPELTLAKIRNLKRFVKSEGQ